MFIRKAQAADVPLCYDIRNRAIKTHCTDFYTPEQLALWTQGGISEALIKDIVATFYVIALNGKVIGSGKLTFETGMVDAIFVDPDAFGQGAATLMLSYLEALAIEKGLSVLRLESTLNAAPFYRLRGFVGEEVSTYHTLRGICLDCIPMEKLLTKMS